MPPEHARPRTASIRWAAPARRSRPVATDGSANDGPVKSGPCPRAAEYGANNNTGDRRRPNLSDPHRVIILLLCHSIIDARTAATDGVAKARFRTEALTFFAKPLLVYISPVGYENARFIVRACCYVDVTNTRSLPTRPCSEISNEKYLRRIDNTVMNNTCPRRFTRV